MHTTTLALYTTYRNIFHYVGGSPHIIVGGIPRQLFWARVVYATHQLNLCQINPTTDLIPSYQFNISVYLLL